MFKLFLYIILTQITWAITPIPQGYVAPAPLTAPMVPFAGTVAAILERTPTMVNGYHGYGGCISKDGNYVFGGLSTDSGGANYGGSGVIYKKSGSTWVQDILITPGLASNMQFGATCALDGTGSTLAVAAYNNNTVHIYNRVGSTWDAPIVLSAAGIRGLSLSEDGTKLVLAQQSGGHILYYERTGNTYTLVQDMVHGNTCHAAVFSGDAMYLAAHNGLGGFKIYKREGTGANTWVLKQDVPMTGSYKAYLDRTGTTLLLGAQTANSNVGMASVYKRVGETWTLMSDLPGTGAATQQYGYGVALSDNGTEAYIGTFTGAYARQYIRSGDTWTLGQTYSPSGASRFGKDVAITRDFGGGSYYLLLGSSGSTASGTSFAGLIYIYK